jgi:antitoxin (DNA-binding transcriptional repressor) of toxin-antitoxin stability system
MKAVSVREFKASFNSIVKKKKEIIVTRRGKPIGIFRPIEDKDEILIKERTEVGKKLIGLGDSVGGRVSEEHDDVIYER